LNRTAFRRTALSSLDTLLQSLIFIALLLNLPFVRVQKNCRDFVIICQILLQSLLLSSFETSLLLCTFSQSLVVQFSRTIFFARCSLSARCRSFATCIVYHISLTLSRGFIKVSQLSCRPYLGVRSCPFRSWPPRTQLLYYIILLVACQEVLEIFFLPWGLPLRRFSCSRSQLY